MKIWLYISIKFGNIIPFNNVVVDEHSISAHYLTYNVIILNGFLSICFGQLRFVTTIISVFK